MQPAKSKQSLLNLTLCVKITHLSLRYQSEKINPERTQVNFRKSETVKKIILALYQIKRRQLRSLPFDPTFANILPLYEKQLRKQLSENVFGN